MRKGCRHRNILHLLLALVASRLPSRTRLPHAPRRSVSSTLVPCRAERLENDLR